MLCLIYVKLSNFPLYTLYIRINLNSPLVNIIVIFCPIFLVLAVVILLAFSLGSVPLLLLVREVLGCLTGTAGGVRLVGERGTTSAVLFTGLTRLSGGENNPDLLLGMGGDADWPLPLLLVGDGI